MENEKEIKEEVKEEVEEKELPNKEGEVQELDATDGDTLTPNEDKEEGSEPEQQSEPEVMPSESSEPKNEEPEPEKMLTQSQVNELVGKARQEGRESAMKELFNRYGVGTDDELNEVFGKGQTYDDLNDEFSAQGNSLSQVKAENALLKSHIDENRWEDVKLILGGKGLEVSAENIEQMLPSHPEWRSNNVSNVAGGGNIVSPEMAEQFAGQVGATKTEEVGKLRKLGNDITEKAEISEEEQARKLFNI